LAEQCSGRSTVSSNAEGNIIISNSLTIKGHQFRKTIQILCHLFP
jgi:hypothetical protein